jgi:hypothetical protein
VSLLIPARAILSCTRSEPTVGELVGRPLRPTSQRDFDPPPSGHQDIGRGFVTSSSGAVIPLPAICAKSVLVVVGSDGVVTDVQLPVKRQP